MACRDPKRAENAWREILKVKPEAQLLDLSDLESIRSFVREFKSRYDHLDVLVNNAGMFTRQMTTTKDGFESHIGTNYLGTFLLTLLLLESLLKAADNPRFLSSSTMPMELLDLNNLMMKDQQLGIFTPYSNSKLCLTMFSKQLARLLSGSNQTAALEALIDWLILVPLEEGTATVLHCALSKSLSGESGRFYLDLTEWERADGIIERHSRQNLWELSENLVGLEGFANNFLNDFNKNTA